MNERLHGLIKRAISTKEDLHPSRPNTLKLGNSAQTNTVLAECLYDEIGPRLRLLPSHRSKSQFARQVLEP